MTIKRRLEGLRPPVTGNEIALNHLARRGVEPLIAVCLGASARVNGPELGW